MKTFTIKKQLNDTDKFRAWIIKKHNYYGIKALSWNYNPNNYILTITINDKKGEDETIVDDYIE